MSLSAGDERTEISGGEGLSEVGAKETRRGELEMVTKLDGTFKRLHFI